MIRIKLTDEEREEIKRKHINELSQKRNFLKNIIKDLNDNEVLREDFEKNIENLSKSDLKTNLKEDFKDLSKEITEENYLGLKGIFISSKEELDFLKDFSFEYNLSKLKLKKELTKEEKIYYKFFNRFINSYSSFRTKWEDWNGFEYSKLLNLRTCPYCNSSYIYKYSSSKNEDKTTAELDHYYAKSDYPLLAMSIFNLIPCCHNCNHIKSDRNEEILYPFDDGFDEKAHFKVEGTREFILDYLNLETNEDEIRIKIENTDKKIENNIDIFKLESRYNNHKVEALEIIEKSKIYTDKRVEEYSRILGVSEESIRELIYGFRLEEEKYKDKILSKFTNDILEQLEVN